MLGNLAVAKSKTIQKDKNADSPTPANEASGNASKPDAQAGVPAVPAPPVKRPLGAKEPIPFQWKLMGKSHGFLMTLFKSIERDEVEAQYERVLRDGYYKDVEIVDIGAKIQQTKAAKAALSAQLPAKKTPKPEKTRANKFVSVMRIKSVAPIPKASAKRKRTKAAKTSAKTAKKAKSTKRTATKKAATRKTAAKKTVKAKSTRTRKATPRTATKSVAKSATKSATKKTTKRVVKKKKKK